MYLKAIDNMIPDHQVRMAYLSRRLSSSGALVVMTHGTSVAEKGPVQDTIDNNMHELVESFRQSAEARLPEIKGHDDIRQQLDDFFQIPILFGSMIDPTERIGFQTVLFFGPPGTGKTLLARSLASKREMTFFNVASEVLTSKYVGDTEKLVHDVVNFSIRGWLTNWRIIKALADVAKKHKPSIVFIDEIDSLTRQRQSSESSFDRRSKNSLLEMFNEISHEPSIFIIGATNRPWDLDPAFLSRFQHKVYLGLPSASDYLVSASRISSELTLFLSRFERYECWHPSRRWSAMASSTSVHWFLAGKYSSFARQLRDSQDGTSPTQWQVWVPMYGLVRAPRYLTNAGVRWHERLTQTSWIDLMHATSFVPVR